MRKKPKVNQKAAVPAKTSIQSIEPMQDSITFAAAKSVAGPIPSAEQFALYVQAQPDAGDRILKMAEASLEFRIKADHKIIDSNNKLNHMGLIANFLISLSPIIAAVVLALNDSPIAAAVVGGGGAVAITSTVIYAIIRALRVKSSDQTAIEKSSKARRRV